MFKVVAVWCWEWFSYVGLASPCTHNFWPSVLEKVSLTKWLLCDFSFSKSILIPVRWDYIIEIEGDINGVLFLSDKELIKRIIYHIFLLSCGKKCFKTRVIAQWWSTCLVSSRLQVWSSRGKRESKSPFRHLCQKHNWKTHEVFNTYYMFRAALRNGVRDGRNWGNLNWGIWFACLSLSSLPSDSLKVTVCDCMYFYLLSVF